MFPHTPRFDIAIKQSGGRLAVADIYLGSHRIENDLPISDYTITVDRSSRSRRSGTVTIADPKLMPRLFPQDKLSPFAAELVIRSGLQYPNKSRELIPQGRFVVTEVTGAFDTGLIPTATLLDRAERVFEQSVMQEINYSGSDVFGSIASLIGAADASWTPLEIHPSLENRTIAAGQFDQGTDRWQLIADMALSIDAEVYFDREGNPIMGPVTHVTPQTNDHDSVWILESGPDGTPTVMGRTYARADVYNAVHVVGAAPEKVAGATADPPIPFATVYNKDARSPTNYDGPFGHKLLRLSDSSLKDTVSCYRLAIARLRASSGLGVTISFTCITNPALDVGDIIKVNWPDGTSEFAVVDKLSLKLDGSMEGSTVGLTYV